GVRLCRSQCPACGRAGDPKRSPSGASGHRVRGTGCRRDGTRPQLLHRVRTVVAADRPVQGRADRVHAGAAQHRRPQRARHRGRPDCGIRAVLLTAPSAIGRLPSDLTAAIDESWTRVRAAPGFLTEREARFLALVAACTPGRGTILEIGSYKGKSTVGLASIAQRYGLGPVVSVDPHSAPAVTDFGHG